LAGFSIWSGLLARISLDSAGPRDVRALAASLARLPGVKDALDAMKRRDGAQLPRSSTRSTT
jgi:DNA mismatch repair ATPase MutS